MIKQITANIAAQKTCGRYRQSQRIPQSTFFGGDHRGTSFQNSYCRVTTPLLKAEIVTRTLALCMSTEVNLYRSTEEFERWLSPQALGTIRNIRSRSSIVRGNLARSPTSGLGFIAQ